MRMKTNHLLKLLVFTSFIISSSVLYGQVPIASATELAAITDMTGSYKLTANITLNQDWTPIGTETEPFSGTFDGNGYVISGLNINQYASDNRGLFGYTSMATIMNLGVENANIRGRNGVGTIVGNQRGGIIRQCYVTSSRVEGLARVGAICGQMGLAAVVENCYASASVSLFTNSEAGGITGLMQSGKVSKCYFAGTVEAENSRANGIVGLVTEGESNAKIIENCVNLSPTLLVKSDLAYPAVNTTGHLEHYRIVDKGTQPVSLANNHSLSGTLLGRSAQNAMTLQKQDVVIMSFNVPYFSDSESNEIKRWNYRKAAIVSLIKEKKPMVLGMQEFRKDPQLDYLDSQISDEYARIGVGRDDGANGGDFSVIYYRKDALEVIKSGDFWMSTTPNVPSFGWGAAHRRLTTWGHFRLKSNGKEILLYNTHLAHDVQKAKEESIKMMADSIAGRLTDKVKTVIVTGDFNENTTNVIFKPFHNLVWSTRDEAALTDKGGTVNGWAAGRTTEIIDHVFYRNCFPKSFAVITNSYDGVALMSDHYPVISEIEIPLDNEYGADGGQGVSIVRNQDVNTKQFYNSVLNWDFIDVWSIQEGTGLPRLKVFNKRNSYEISDVNGLKAISNDLNGNYTLTADITLTENWLPIGTEAAPFTGIFNGNGKVIRGLKHTTTSVKMVGLFSVTNEAIIRNLGIETAAMNGDADVAAIVGVMNGGLMDGCYVANSTIEGRDHVAALVGKIQKGAVIQNCYSSANVSSRATQAGGLCGVILDNGTRITKSYFSGKVSVPTGYQRPAGIVALVDNNGRVSIDNCVNLASTIHGSNNARIAHYGNYGVTTDLLSNYSKSNTSMNAYDAVVSTADANYGATKMHGANLPNDNQALSREFYSSVLGWDFDNGTWKMPENGGYPVPEWQSSPIDITIFGQKSNYQMTASAVLDLNKLVTINNADNILQFSTSTEGVTITSDNKLKIDNPDAAPTSIAVSVTAKSGFNLLVTSALTVTISVIPDLLLIESVSDLSKIETYPFANFKLTTNLDLTGVTFSGLCSETVPFTGVLDGDGHIISNMTITSSGARATGFLKVAKGATISNLGFDNARVRLTSNHKSAGVIIGLMRGGLLEQCFVKNSFVEGYDHAGSVVGSIEGLNEKADAGALVRNCYGTGNEVYSRSYQAGGFSGTIMKGTVEKCYFSGLVRNDRDRSVGMFGYVDNSGHTAADVVVRQCVNLATEIRSVNFTRAKLFRIIDNNNASDRPMTLSSNYSLPSTVLTGSDGTGTATTELNTSGRNGSNIVNTADAQKASFYTSLTQWDFTNVWEIQEGLGYPSLKVFNKENTALDSNISNKKRAIVFVQDNVVCIKNISPMDKVTVYFVNGQRIANVNAQTSEVKQTLPFKGIYLVKVTGNESVVKVINN